MIEMIDTHCHIDHKQFDPDRAAMIERAFADGIEAMVIPAIEPARFDAVRALVASDPRIYCGMGIHPHHATEATDEALADVEKLSFGERVQAIGEIGLDYHYDFAPRDVQQDVFRKQIRIAKRRNLPIIVHNRESDDDVLRIIREEQDAAHGELRGVLHCFSGTPEQAAQAVALGFHVSFTGNITFKKSMLDETVRSLPFDRIMMETDAPYMTPVPFRGKRNEPAFVRLVAEKLAEIRSTSLQEVFTMTTTTAQRFFNLPMLTVLAVTVLIVTSFAATAQTTKPAQEEDDEPATEAVNPYPKKIGIAPILGSNTFVESFQSTGQRTSDRGFLGFGGGVWVQLSESFNLGASYLRYTNNNPTKLDPNTGLPRQENPNVHESIDAYIQWTFNPANTISFFLLGGPTRLSNAFDYNGGGNGNTFRSFWGIFGAFGLGANLKTPLGLFYPSAEFRISTSWGLSEERKYALGNNRFEILTQTGFTYSVARFSLWWFPNF